MKERSLVALRIEQIRKAKNLTRRELAAQLGVTYLQVYRIENGVTDVSATAAAAFAAALGVTVSQLYREARAS